MPTLKTVLMLGAVGLGAYMLLKPSTPPQQVEETTNSESWVVSDFTDALDDFWGGSLDDTADWMTETYQSSAEWLSETLDFIFE